MNEWAIQPAQPDPRDYPFAVKVQPFLVEADGNRPKKIGRSRLYMRDQGQFGSCGGQAIADAIDLRQGVMASALFAYRHAKAIDGIEGEGTDVRSLMKVAKDIGVCREELYQYSLYKKPLVFPDIPKEATDDAAKRKIEGYARCVTRDELLTAIWQYRSVVCGILVATNFITGLEYSSAGAFVDLPEGYIQGGHAIDLIDYDEDLVHTYKDGNTYKGFCLLANSWGTKWGDKGNAWIPFDFLFGKLIDLGVPYAWDMFAPIEEFPYQEEWFEMDVAPFMQSNRTFTPARFVAEALGAKVGWHPEDGQGRVSMEAPGVMVEMWIDSKRYRVQRGVK